MESTFLGDKRRLAALGVVGGLYFTASLGIDMFVALLPAVAATFAVSTAGLVWVLTARSGSRFASPVFGRLSDRLGRKRILLPCLLAFALGNLGSGFAPDLGWLTLAQIAVGVGLAGLQVTLPSYLGDLFHYNVRGRVLGLVSQFSAAGTMLGVPAVAYLAQAVGMRASFLALGGLALALTPLALILLIAPALPVVKPDAPPEPHAAWHAPLRHGSVRAMIVITLCWLLMLAGCYTFLATWLQQTLGFTIGQIGLVFAMTGGAAAIANLLVASFSDRLGKRRLMLIGLALGVLSLVPLGLTTGWPLLAAIAIFALTNEMGFSAYAVLITELVPAQRGMVFSLHMAAWGLGVALAPLPASLLWQAGGFPLLVLTMSLVGLAGFLVAVFFLARPAAPRLLPASSGIAPP